MITINWHNKQYQLKIINETSTHYIVMSDILDIGFDMIHIDKNNDNIIKID